MKSKISEISKRIISILFWCLVWQFSAMLVGNDFLLPDIPSTLKALLTLVTTSSFYSAVLLSALRVVIGLIIGSLLGVILAILSHKHNLVFTLISPLISVIKSTPVASFIVVLWVMMSGDALSIFVAFLMVMPIIWQNILDGYSSVDKNLIEIADVFQFAPLTRFKHLIFPALKKFFIPAFITASGLAWKAEIAAEIIAYTKNSIGQGINDAKYHMETPMVFAWTLIIIVLSIFLEYLTKRILWRAKK